MSYDNDPMTGMLFVNKSDNPRAPKLSGFVVLEDGTKVSLAVWPATRRETGERINDKRGNPFFNIKASRDDEDNSRSRTERQPVQEDPDVLFE